MRVGRLERVQPIFLLIDTPKRPLVACFGTLRGKRMGGDLALVGSRQEGRAPWRVDNPREDRLQSCG